MKMKKEDVWGPLKIRTIVRFGPKFIGLIVLLPKLSRPTSHHHHHFGSKTHQHRWPPKTHESCYFGPKLTQTRYFAPKTHVRTHILVPKIAILDDLIAILDDLHILDRNFGRFAHFWQQFWTI